MKKALFILGAVLALCACSKIETVVSEESNEISVNAVAGVQTKGAELVGTALPDTWNIGVGASTTQQPAFLNGQLFKYDSSTSTWRGNSGTAVAPVYWPLGGEKVDFLAYAQPANDLSPAFDGTKKADKFTVSAWNTYNTQVDLLYAAANSYKNQRAAVPMEFNHALALIIVNVRHNTGAGDLAFTNITFGTKNTTGTLEVNNEYNKLALIWSGLSTADLKVPATAAATAATTVVGPNGAAAGCKKYEDVLPIGPEFYQLGETLLVIPQPASNPQVTFTLDGLTYNLELNAKRLDWEAGKAYIYDISFNNNEITLAPTVVNWVVEDPS
jgi:hypothetical protein